MNTSSPYFRKIEDQNGVGGHMCNRDWFWGTIGHKCFHGFSICVNLFNQLPNWFIKEGAILVNMKFIETAELVKLTQLSPSGIALFTCTQEKARVLAKAKYRRITQRQDFYCINYPYNVSTHNLWYLFSMWGIDLER